ncbi:MAG: glutamate-5-semialdehyde dehydrogenase [Clostridiales bacterium]|nr:glutamate-5-semialdehyde dehydrogenase [Clostridiales bacterium]
MNSIEILAARAKKASRVLSNAGSETKKNALGLISSALWEQREKIIEANLKDIEAGIQNNMRQGLIDRLKLDEKRIRSACDGVISIAGNSDPIGKVDSMWTLPNGLRIGKRRVPLGVVGIIYEARPNVTADAAALCLMTGNACVLRGGKEAINSNIAISDIMRDVIAKAGLPADCITLVTDTTRESSMQMMKANGLIDVLIPRGSAGLISAVVENATVPVIETGIGICHTYVDEGADLNTALDIVENAKCSRPSVCNALEVLLVAESEAAEFLPMVRDRLKSVEFRGCEKTLKIIDCVEASGEDFRTEFLDYIMAIKIVSGIDEAIEEININGSGHSEAIVTNSYQRSERFLAEVDAAAVFVNASTRFTDGGEFGFGGEIGISTQKFHARGPMGLSELTSYKYIIYGSGQIRV